MLPTKNVAIFKATFPDDTVWDEDGVSLVPRGENLIRSIHTVLREKGWQCSDPAQHSFYGWSFSVQTVEGRAHVIIQYVDPWLMIVTKKPSLWKRLRGIPDDRVDSSLINVLDDILTMDDQISGVEWQTRERSLEAGY
jgi:hypothetical protein